MAIVVSKFFKFFIVSLLALSLATLFFELTRKLSIGVVKDKELWLLAGYSFTTIVFLILIFSLFPEKDKGDLTHPVDIIEGQAVLPLPEAPIG